MEKGRPNLVSINHSIRYLEVANGCSEHTMLVTDDGVEILTGRLPDSPGGPVLMPDEEPAVSETNGGGKAANGSEAK